jgi:cytochrome P450
VSASDLAFSAAPRLRPPAPIPNETPLGSLAFLIRFWQNPLTTWTRHNFEWPITQADGVLGRVAVVCEPGAIRRIFIDNVANYRKDALQLRVLAPGLGNGVLTAEGDDWRRQRRALAPLFTPRVVEDFIPAMSAAAQWLIDRWSPLRDGRRLDVAAEMSLTTLEVLQRTIFPAGIARDPREFAGAMTDFFESNGRLHPFDLIGAPSWLPRLGKRSPASSLQFFDRAVEDIVAERQSASDGSGFDLLSMLLSARDPQTGEGLDPAQIRANIVTFIAAGHETTANALTWSLFLLSQHSAWRETVEREVDEILDDRPIDARKLGHLTRVRATIDEALRLYPPAPSLSREAIAPDILAGQTIRAKSLVVVPPYVVHRHKLLWRDPELFDPTRFLPGEREKIDRFAYMPFGAGPRVCIGMGFALQEATIVLAMILREFRLELAPGHEVTPVQRITLRPKGGMPMLMRRRAPSSA